MVNTGWVAPKKVIGFVVSIFLVEARGYQELFVFPKQKKYMILCKGFYVTPRKKMFKVEFISKYPIPATSIVLGFSAILTPFQLVRNYEIFKVQ